MVWTFSSLSSSNPNRIGCCSRQSRKDFVVLHVYDVCVCMLGVRFVHVVGVLSYNARVGLRGELPTQSSPSTLCEAGSLCCSLFSPGWLARELLEPSFFPTSYRAVGVLGLLTCANALAFA